jgi:hypothetical protein
VADTEHQDDQAIVLDRTDEAISADAVFPEFSEFGTMERFSDGAWVCEFGEALAQKL